MTDRVIKFRGLYPGDPTKPRMMVYGSLICSERLKEIMCEDSREWCVVVSSTVGQFTGLHDKNGKEIYEGDIFTSDDYPFTSDGNKNYVGIIQFDFRPEYLGWCYDIIRVSTRVRGGAGAGNLSYLDFSQLQVIGNIHEHPELTELKDD